MANSLQPHGLQHTRHPCSSPSPWVCSNSCPLSRWCHPTISSSIVPFSSCLQSFPASESFPVSQLFTSDGQSVGASAPASDLPVNSQGWFPLGTLKSLLQYHSSDGQWIMSRIGPHQSQVWITNHLWPSMPSSLPVTGVRGPQELYQELHADPGEATDKEVSCLAGRVSLGLSGNQDTNLCKAATMGWFFCYSSRHFLYKHIPKPASACLPGIRMGTEKLGTWENKTHSSRKQKDLRTSKLRTFFSCALCPNYRECGKNF